MTQFNRALLSATLRTTAFSILLAAYAAAAPKSIEIRVLSGRADMVTGGDALVEVAFSNPARQSGDTGPAANSGQAPARTNS